MLFGVGTNDIEGQTDTDGYKVWSSMLRRCYNAGYQKTKPTYKGCEVASGWHRLSGFLPWFDANYKPGWQLDKDILVKDNRVYSENTCCFVPKDVNSALIARKSKTGLPVGVFFKKKNGKYCAQMSRSCGYNRSSGYIGLYNTVEAAFAAYKAEKESYLKELATKYKETLTPRCYEALMNWNVEITD